MKRKYSPEKDTGIWIDQNNAYIISLEKGKDPMIREIESGVESRIRIPGERKVYARFGRAFIDDQEKKQRRQRNQRRRYFKNIIALVHDDDYLFLFGPGRGKEELNNAIEKDETVKCKVMAIEPADRLTQNQLFEKVNEFFTSDEFKLAKRKLRRMNRSMV